MKRLIAASAAVLSLTTFGVVAVATVAGTAASATASGTCAADGTTPGPTGGGPSLAASAAFAAGFRGNDLVMAVAIAGAESSYRPTVRNSIGASGLWQILQSAHQDLFDRYDWRDPEQNALMAISVWSAAHRSWTPWTTFTGGTYRAHLPEAHAAVAALGKDTTHPTAADSRDARPTTSVSVGKTAPRATTAGRAGSPPACAPAAGGLPPAPAPFTGRDGYVDDPTSRGRITRRMLHTYEEINRASGGRWPWGVGCWDQHAWNPTSDHPKGKACDFAVGRIGTHPDDAQRATGWQLAHWLQVHAGALDLAYIIWDGRIWSRTRSQEGWRRYGGGGVYDVGTPTGGHMDHLHVNQR